MRLLKYNPIYVYSWFYAKPQYQDNLHWFAIPIILNTIFTNQSNWSEFTIRFIFFLAFLNQVLNTNLGNKDRVSSNQRPKRGSESSSSSSTSSSLEPSALEVSPLRLALFALSVFMRPLLKLTKATLNSKGINGTEFKIKATLCEALKFCKEKWIKFKTHVK